MDEFITDGNVCAHISDRTASGMSVSHSMVVTLEGSFMSEAEIVEKTVESVDEFCQVHRVVPSIQFSKICVLKGRTIVHLHC